jgi:hypothetical protein
VEIDVTLTAGELDGTDEGDCLLRASLARLPRGGALQVRGADPPALERLRGRCRDLGYHVGGEGTAGSDDSLLVAKGGQRGGTASAAGEAGSTGHAWSVRASSTDGRLTRLHAGRHSFSAGPAVSFRPDEQLPSAIEYLLAALAADIVSSFARCAGERAAEIDAIECRISGQLDDPLASIGVVGASGSPALGVVTGTLYVSGDAEPSALRGAWCAALRRSPLFNTLAPCVSLRIEMRAEP